MIWTALPLATCFSWWKAHYDRDGNPPSRSQFDIGDFLPYASQMFLASKTSDGEWVYKVRGEAFKELFGPLKTEVDVGRYRYRVFDMPVSDYLNLVAENGNVPSHESEIYLRHECHQAF